MRKTQPSTTLADRLTNMTVEVAYPYCQYEIANGHKFHDTLFLALEKMSKDIKKRFKSGDVLAMDEAKMLIELCKKLNDDFSEDVYYIIYAIKMGEFAERCIKSDPSNSNAIELLGFYKLICNNVIYNRQ